MYVLTTDSILSIFSQYPKCQLDVSRISFLSFKSLYQLLAGALITSIFCNKMSFKHKFNSLFLSKHNISWSFTHIHFLSWFVGVLTFTYVRDKILIYIFSFVLLFHSLNAFVGMWMKIKKYHLYECMIQKTSVYRFATHVYVKCMGVFEIFSLVTLFFIALLLFVLHAIFLALYQIFLVIHDFSSLLNGNLSNHS